MKSAVILVSLLVSIFGQDVVLLSPTNPLSAAGLATPWQNNLNQSCPGNAVFVQGAWFDPNTNNVFAYNPLVITMGTTAAVAPTAPVLPAGAVVGLWFGANSNTLTLADANNGQNLANANCVNGVVGSIFGQYAYCNAGQFYSAANIAINAGTLKVPPLGTANDGLPCPTTRDFFIIDMDQSDNVITTYIVTTTTQLAQNTITNQNNLGNKVANTLTNGSDLRLVSVAIDTALGCTPWKVQDMAEVGNVNSIPTFPTAEIQAAVWQAAPVALVPISHAMCRVNNQPSLLKTNMYRAGANQPNAANVQAADGFIYCQNFYFTAPKRMAINAAAFSNFGSPDPNAATNLFAFMGQRFATAFGPDGLNCAALLNVAPPVVPIKNMMGIFVGATITVPNPPAAGGLGTNNIIIIVVCTVVGGLLIIGLIVGIIWYRNRSMYS
jgi:hypothetical protein